MSLLPNPAPIAFVGHFVTLVGRPFQGRRHGVAAMVALTALSMVSQPTAQTPKHLALVGGMLLTGYEVPPIHHAADRHRGQQDRRRRAVVRSQDSGRRDRRRHQRPRRCCRA